MGDVTAAPLHTINSRVLSLALNIFYFKSNCKFLKECVKD